MRLPLGLETSDVTHNAPSAWVQEVQEDSGVRSDTAAMNNYPFIFTRAIPFSMHLPKQSPVNDHQTLHDP